MPGLFSPVKLEIMNKVEIQQHLRGSHEQFVTMLLQLTEQEFLYTSNKWTAGQQLEHIIKSVSPVNLAFSFPLFVLKLSFGKANRPSRTYEALVERYQLKLAQGGKSTKQFLPKTVLFSDRSTLTDKLRKLVASLIHKIESFSEEQLDFYILPHPLLGKLTLREMLYFTIYHVGHHQKQVTQNLLQKTK